MLNIPSISIDNPEPTIIPPITSVVAAGSTDPVTFTVPDPSIVNPDPILIPPNAYADAIGIELNLLLNVFQSVRLKYPSVDAVAFEILIVGVVPPLDAIGADPITDISVLLPPPPPPIALITPWLLITIVVPSTLTAPDTVVLATCKV